MCAWASGIILMCTCNADADQKDIYFLFFFFLASMLKNFSSSEWVPLLTVGYPADVWEEAQSLYTSQIQQRTPPSVSVSQNKYICRNIIGQDAVVYHTTTY